MIWPDRRRLYLIAQVVLHIQMVLVLLDEVTALCLRMDMPYAVWLDFFGHYFLFPLLLANCVNYSVQLLISYIKRLL